MGKKNKRKLDELNNNDSNDESANIKNDTQTPIKKTFQSTVPLSSLTSKALPVQKIVDLNPKQKQKVNANEWNFAVDYNDHFETPKIAYIDLAPALQSLATTLGKTLDQLVIYDPYWCKGNMVSRLAELGFTNVINKNRDFYKDIKNNHVPGQAAHNISYCSLT